MKLTAQLIILAIGSIIMAMTPQMMMMIHSFVIQHTRASLLSTETARKRMKIASFARWKTPSPVETGTATLMRTTARSKFKTWFLLTGLFVSRENTSTGTCTLFKRLKASSSMLKTMLLQRDNKALMSLMKESFEKSSLIPAITAIVLFVTLMTLC